MKRKMVLIIISLIIIFAIAIAILIITSPTSKYSIIKKFKDNKELFEKSMKELSSEANIYDEYGRLKPSNPYYNTVKNETNYKVYTDESGFNYYYKVYNNIGECIDSGFHTGEITFECIDNILSVKMGFGTYAFICRYYDLSTSRVSRFYTTPLEISGEYIAYFTKNHKNDENSIILVIQNIFDEKVYYQEIKRAFSSKVLDLYSETEFINNNTQLKISYLINSSDEIITEVIDLK